MSELTREYLEKQLKEQTQDLKDYVKQEIDDLAAITATGFEEIKKELDVRIRVEKLEKDYVRIKEALNLGK